MPSSDYTPEVADVGNLLRARTRDDDGNELGTFTPATSPTDEQATALIAEAVQEMEARIGSDIPERLFGPARAITSLLAAMNVETTYYPEQVSSGKSAHDAYERRVNAALGTPSKSGWLVKAIVDESSGGAEGPEDDDLLPVFNFDDPLVDGELTYDPVTQSWVLRAPPPPSADEGPVVQVWE